VQVLDEAAARAARQWAPRRQAAAAARHLPTLWNNDERFRSLPHRPSPATTRPADAGFMDEDGYLYIMAAPTTSSTSPATACPPGGMEEVLASHPDVAECAVIGVHDELKGSSRWASSC
jgi:propionyl-CoA synthetase